MVAMDCPEHRVIGLLDGDDWFYDRFVLERVAKVYKEEDVWLTFGSFEFYPTGQRGWVRPYSKKVVTENSFRKVPNVLPTHFKTFYAWLFHKIKLKDLLYEGEFYSVAGDVAMMFPLIEMAGVHHKCIMDLNYIYNIDNPLNDFNTQLQKQLTLDHYIRNKKPYKPFIILYFQLKRETMKNRIFFLTLFFISETYARLYVTQELAGEDSAINF